MHHAPLYVRSRRELTLSTERSRLDIDAIHAYLTRSYWSPGIPKHLVSKAIRNSLCFGLYAAGRQAGFARVITDFTTFAYLVDVYVLPEFRGNGVGSWMVETIVNCPLLLGIRSFSLATRDAHAFYAKFGFHALEDPARTMVARYEMEWRQPELAETYPGEREALGLRDGERDSS